ncbi:MAG: hypothetical protein ABIZ09_03755 [Rhodoferax sp.]
MKTAYFIVLIATITVAGTAAQAQSRYTCTVNGRSVISTQPCPNSGIVYYGPTATKSAYEAPLPPSRPAPVHLKYLNPRCASLNDALRTAGTRGLKSDTVNQMQREYSELCAENESEAYGQVLQERKDNKKKLSESKEAEKLNQERSLEHQQQCGESKRILYTKRARKDLTDGEKADLQRFEDNYHNRCG